MTEDEAKTKWCPMSRLAGAESDNTVSHSQAVFNRLQMPNASISLPSGVLCIGSACMMWLWLSPRTNDASVEDLDLKLQRSRNILRAESIETIGQLCAKTSTDLLKIPNCGLLTIKDIKQALDKRGLRLGMQKPSDDGYCGLAGKS
jgi:hypothetical protein